MLHVLCKSCVVAAMAKDENEKTLYRVLLTYDVASILHFIGVGLTQPGFQSESELNLVTTTRYSRRRVTKIDC